MARTFASGDKIRCSPGTAATVTAAVSIAVICRTDSSRDNQWRALYSSLTSGGGHTQGYNIELGSNNKMVLGSDGGAFGNASTTNTLNADGWCAHVTTKAAGTSTPQYNRYKYSTATFVLAENHTATENNATAGGLVEIGGDFGGSSDFFVGDIAIVGVWDRVLSATEIQALPFTLQAWYSFAPRGLWLLDQSATGQLLADLTGGGANQSAITGTSVGTGTSVPIFNYTDGVWQPTLPPPSGGGTTYTKTSLFISDGSAFSGADAVTASETASMIVGNAALSGADAFTAVESSQFIVGNSILSAVSQTPVSQKTSLFVVGGSALSGADVFTATETASVIVGNSILSGADANTFTETASFVIGNSIFSGASALNPTAPTQVLRMYTHYGI